jgi:quercetin dioxygenase-like cupin family protein
MIMEKGPGVAGISVRRLDEMVGGWFVGAFEPVVFPSEHMEVAVKRYPAGAVEAPHVHRESTELTLIVDGEARMANRVLRAGDIIVLPPGTATGFEALQTCTTVVVKSPSVPGDKYPAELEPPA